MERHFCGKFFLLPALALLFSGTALYGDAFIGYLYPSGAKRGETVDIIVGGQQMGINTVLLSGGGYKVEKISYVAGFNHPYPVQRRYILAALKARKAGKELPPKPEMTPDWRPHRYYDRIGELTETEFNIAIADFFAVRNSLQSSPAISQRVLVTLTIDKDAKLGRREFRIAGRGSGVSNPIPFYIGDVPEINEGTAEIPPEKPKIKSFTVPASLNGQILPGGEVDRFLFLAKKGEVITFRVRAREFAPFLGDAVPGHFQPIAEIFDGKGKSVAFADYRFFNADPVLTFTVPEDGQYAFTVRDSIYRGRADFVYRVEVFHGLPVQEKLSFPPLPKGVKELAKDEAEKAVLEENVRICGVLEKENAKHSFRFKAEKRKPKILEVLARRYLSPLDAALFITDGKGKILVRNDDPVYPRIGTVHHKADPCVKFIPPEDGVYTATVFAIDGHGGKEYFYALRIDEMRPDFDIVLAPSAPNVAWSGARLFTFHVFPREGFKEDIILSIVGTNEIFFPGTNIIPAGTKDAVLSLAAGGTRNNAPVVFRILAKSKSICKEVIPADEAMQAFAYNHFIPAETFAASRVGKINGEGRFYWRGRTLVPGRTVPVTQERPAKKEPAGKNAPGKAFQKKRNAGKFRPQPRRKVPTRWIPPVYEKVDKVVLKRGGTAELKVYAILTPHDMTYSVVMENPPKGVSIAKTELVSITKDKSSEVTAITLKAEKDAPATVCNQVFKVKMQYDAQPDKNGDIVRKESLVPLPVLRLEVTE